MSATIWAFKSTAADGALDLHIYDTIGSSWYADGVSAKDVLSLVAAQKDLKSINLRVYSLGGILDDGKAIHNLLREKSAQGVKVTAQVDAIAASAATFPVIAADHVVIAKNAMFMIHEGSAGTPGRGTSEDHAKLADRINRENDQMAEMYADASARRGKNVSAKDFRLKMKKETYLSPQEAVELGLADNVGGDSDTAAIAACAFGIGRLNEPPEQLVRLVASLHQPTPRVERLEPRQSAARAEPKEITMTFPILLAALGLNADASETSVISAYNAKLADVGAKAEAHAETLNAHIAELKPDAEFGKKLRAKTGQDGEASYGMITAWEEQAKKVPTLEAQIAESKSASDKSALEALLKSARDAKKLTKDQTDKLQARVEAGLKAKSEKRELGEEEWSLSQAKAYVEALTPNVMLAAAPVATAPRSPTDTSVGEAPLTHADKTYEQMSPDERAQLRAQDGGEDVYQQLRADWKKRGQPRTAKTAAA